MTLAPGCCRKCFTQTTLEGWLQCDDCKRERELCARLRQTILDREEYDAALAEVARLAPSSLH